MDYTDQLLTKEGLQRKSELCKSLFPPGAQAGALKGLHPVHRQAHGDPLQYSCLENLMDRRLAGYGPWGRKESDATEATEQAHDSTLGESSREAQSGRRFLGTNGGSLWL